MTQRCFLHVDMDAFFASVEQLDHPEWKGKPVIVGGLPGERRSVVSTASYEARKFGVHSAMPTFQAYKLCPEGIFTHGNYKRYTEISNKIMQILSDYSPDLVQLSIDEASLEITGTELLFGPPMELAKTIQNRIFNETGLTVSCGIASTKYLAKLSSEVNKPKGLFMINPGEEEKFMRNLPLKDVWGIGKKSLQRLNASGIKTTEDIYQKSLELLQTMFGNNMGLFLYNTVRGIEIDSPKQSTHSISAETTFEYDLTDIYSAETALLALCHTVMFRLLKEKGLSKTAMIKIRYEDFSTITAQLTQEEYITSTDDFYARICSLFESKYQKDRGIRLLGVAVENIESKDKANIQETLFDFGEKKKQSVEKAILDLSTKHPEIKVQKARLLKNLALLIFSGMLWIKPAPAVSQEIIHQNETETAAGITLPQQLLILPESTGEPFTIFNYNSQNSAIEFLTQGWWQATFSGGVETSFNTDGTVSFSNSTPVFKQEIDLSLLFNINKQWFFETNFQEQFLKNTITAGFNGKESNPLKSFKISNRGIIFPDTYSASLFNMGIGGGTNQAPGIYVHLKDPKNNKWEAHGVLRYDMTEQKNTTFYGHNNVNTSEINLENYIKGQFFTLPEELLTKILDVYIESTNGTYKDDTSHYYKKIDHDSFIINSKKSLLIISNDMAAYAKNGKLPSVIITFQEGTNPQNYLGLWQQDDSFLGNIQKAFKQYDLSKFSYDFYTEFNSSSALILQRADGFSPFQFSAYYDCGLSKINELYLGNSETHSTSNSHGAQILSDIISLSGIDFFNEKHSYAIVYSLENQEDPAIQQVMEQFPLCNTSPLTYLTGEQTTDSKIILESYTSVSSFQISTNASSGSVRVYKNGILDSGATYNSQSGEITLSESVSDTDKIYITWEEESSNLSNGKIAFQTGFKYDFTTNLSADFSVQTQIPLNLKNKYTEYEESSLGQVSASSLISYKNSSLELTNAMLAGYENPNTTDYYQITGFDQNASTTVYMDKYAAYLPDSEEIPQIGVNLSENNKVLSTITGIMDKDISGYKIPLEWIFNDNIANQWASINFSLSDGSSLCNADSFELAIKLDNTLDQNLYSIYLQLGVIADTSTYNSYSQNVPYWDISSQIDFNSLEWQTITVPLTHENKSKLTQFHDASIVIVQNSAINQTSTGLVYIGPHQINKTGMYAQNFDLQIVSSQLVDNTVPDISRFNTRDNYVQKISWYNDLSEAIPSEKIIKAVTFFNPVDFSNYNLMEFYLKFEELTDSSFMDTDTSSSKSFITITFDKDSTGIEEDGTVAFKFELTKQGIALLQQSENYNKMSINFQDLTISINDTVLSSEHFNWLIKPDFTILPTRFKIEFSTTDSISGYITKRGNLYLDELYLKGTSPYLIAQDKIKAKISKNKSFLLLEGNASSSIIPNQISKTESTLSALAQTNIDLHYIEIKAKTDVNSNQTGLIKNASQEINTIHPLFGFLIIQDEYTYSPGDQNLNKHSKLSFDFNKYKIPVSLSSDTQLTQNSLYLNQITKFKFETKPKFNQFGLNFSSNMDFTQKFTSQSQNYIDIKKNYFINYLESTVKSVNTGSSTAQNRKINGTASLILDISRINFKPGIKYQVNQNYTLLTDTFSDTSILDFEIPFNINKSSISFYYKKESGNSSYNASNENFYSDLYNYGKSLAYQDYFWTCPFYDLFSDSINSQILSSNQKSIADLTYYNCNYSLKFKRNSTNNVLDLFIPDSSSLSFVRNIQVSDTISDNYIAKLSLFNTSINIFGANSKTKLFKWYKTDEYITGLTTNLKFSKNLTSDPIFELNTYLQASLFIKDNNLIKLGADLSFDQESNWTYQTTLIYKHNANKSPIISLIKLVKKDLDSKQVKLSRSESLNLKLKNTDTIFYQSYEVNHTLNIELYKHFTLNLGLDGLYSHTSSKAAILSLNGTIGGKLSF